MDELLKIRTEGLLELADNKSGPSSDSEPPEINRDSLILLNATATIKPEVHKIVLERKFVDSTSTPFNAEISKGSRIHKKTKAIKSEQAKVQSEINDKISTDDNIQNLWPVDSHVPAQLRGLTNDNAYLSRVLGNLLPYLPSIDPDLENIQKLIDEAMELKIKK